MKTRYGEFWQELMMRSSSNKASSVEKATRSARNAVCQRLCDSAGIEYELGWWKGSRHKARRDFVDNFIGTPLYVQIDDEIEIDLHEVPYEVYTIQQVRLTFRKMTLMTPDNIDAWGFLHWGQAKMKKCNYSVKSYQFHLTYLPQKGTRKKK